jgi:DNA-binding winged helix-turn-helix (wHTH) protein/tetratricopeptide (TPR) repeat protein
MNRPAESGNLFRFGVFEADAVGCTLTRNGARVKIQDQPFRLLVLLLERPGEVVTRDELRQALWAEGTHVDFDGSLNVILKRLRAAVDDDPDNPRFIETIPRRGYRFIAPVSASGKASAATPPGTETIVVPKDPTPPQTANAPAASGRSADLHSRFLQKRRLPLYAACALTLVLLTLAGWIKWGARSTDFASSHSPADNPPVQMRRSVAILGFKNLSGRADDAWLATALSEMLSTELAAGERLRLVSGEDVANLRMASPWSQTETLDSATTARIRSALNSDVLVLGSYMTIGASHRGQLRLDVRMQDAKTGEILTEVAEVGNTQEFFRLVSRIGAQLRNRLGIEELQGSEEAGVLAALPLDADAARFYALGVTKLRQFDALAARDLLQQAAAADPKFSMVHAMLARAWALLGYKQERLEEAKKALDLATDLPRAQRMLVEGEYYESLGNHEQAASVYHALFELFPDNIEYGLRLAGEQSIAGHGGQAMEVIHRMRSLPPPSSDDPRIDLVEARAMKDNKPATLAIVRIAMRKASDRGQRLLYGLARKEECMVLLYGEQPDQAAPSCEDAYNIFLAAGNRVAAADAMRLMADGIGAQGHYEQAIATYQRALRMLEGLGDHEKTGAILNNMAINYGSEGKLDRAEQLYAQAKLHFEQAGDRTNIAETMVNLADIAYLRGNLPRAAKLYQETLDFIATLDHGEPQYVLYRVADLELAQGNVKQAQRLAQQAVDGYRPIQGAYQYLTAAMIELGKALEFQGDLAGARSQFEQTLAIRQKVGALQLAAESQIELAHLAIEEGHPEQAESLLRAALAEFEKEKNDPDASSAYTLLSQALLRQGQLDEARKAALHGADLSLTNSDPALKLAAQIQQSRVKMATASVSKSGLGAAQQHLESVIGTAKRLGYLNLEYEARLSMGELEVKTKSSSAHKHLTSLASETHNLGLELLARRAEAAMASGMVEAANRSAH